MSGWTEADLREFYNCRESSPIPAEPKRPKYNNRKKEVDGHMFDSTKEARHYIALRALEKAGIISGLILQPRFVLQASCEVSGRKLRAITYRADFEFRRRRGERVVQDVKSKATMTAAYRIKAKLFQANFPDILFEEIL